MQHHKWVSALDLQQWAPSSDAKLRLPELLRRLVHATLDKAALEKVEFPSGEQIYRPGFDGVTKVLAGNFKVPVGITNWEMGTDVKVKSKLNDDYEKRVKHRGEGDFSQVTYVAVTPYTCRDKSVWAAEKIAEKKWSDVRVYDSDDLEQWMEVAPSVAILFSNLIGKLPDGVVDLSYRWQVLQALLRKPLSPSLLLVGRQQTVLDFQAWVDAPPGVLKLVGHSPQEVIDIFTAWVESSAPEAQNQISSRTLIVESPDAWRKLATAINGLILVAAEQLELDEN